MECVSVAHARAGNVCVNALVYTCVFYYLSSLFDALIGLLTNFSENGAQILTLVDTQFLLISRHALRLRSIGHHNIYIISILRISNFLRRTTECAIQLKLPMLPLPMRSPAAIAQVGNTILNTISKIVVYIINGHLSGRSLLHML